MKPNRTRTMRLRRWHHCAATIALLAMPAAHAAYPDLILSDNPVAYYRLEEVSGTTAFDSTTNHFDATYVIEGAYPQQGLPGITTNSVLFQNSAPPGHILIPYQPELNPKMPDGLHGAPFSVECWVQATAQPADYCIPLAMFGSYGDPAPLNNASGWNFYQEPPGQGGRWVFNFKNGAFMGSGVVVELVKWYHLAATFDGATAVFYVDGVARNTANGITGYYANPSHAGQIGAGNNVGFLPFTGNVDEVAFYTNVLSGAQILAHYQLGTNSFREVPTPPGFLQQPASRTNFHGTTASFSAVANGTAPLSYQWKRGSSPIPGATTSSYSLLARYPGDDGATFSVTVTNSVGTTNSDVVTLTVDTNLNILNQPYGPITRNVGSKAAYRVVANGALPITYQWNKVVSGNIVTPIPGATGDTLWLSNVQLPDNQSEYFVHITGPFTSTDSARAQLLVQARPVTVPFTGYAKIIVADDPVAYWRLDEVDASPTATDAVGSFDGTYTVGAGTLNYQTNGIPTDTNTAIKVMGGSIVSIPYALEINPVTGPWSFEAWIKPALQPGDFATAFSSMYVVPGSITGWNLYQHAGGYWTMNMFAGGTGGSFNSDLFDHPLEIGSWYHLVISDDLTTIRLIVNGVQRSSLSRNGFGFRPNGINGDPAVAGGATVLGHRGDSAFLPFDGAIDEVAVYNKALTVQQADLHYRSSTRLTANPSSGNLVLTWGVGNLQAASSVTGPYTNVAGATSPHNVPASEAQKYYRVQVLP